MKVDLLTLFPDQTCSFERKKIVEDHVKIRGYNPKLKAGKNVFPERPTSFWQKIGFKKRKRLVVWVYGANFCYTLSEDIGKLDNHWSVSEGENIVNKMIAWAAAKTKLFSKMEVYIFWILLGITVLMQFLILRRIGI